MSAGNVPTAKAFRDAFIASYFNVCDRFTEVEWVERWSPRQWNLVMLWPTTEDYNPPRQSVLAETAASLGLNYANGEPLRLDAVFSSQRENFPAWFPILVAIEHENNCYGFVSEVTKLLSVQCPLKVGITYTYSRAEKRLEKLEGVERTIWENFERISSVVHEGQGTQYLFLVGSEISEMPRRVSWYFLEFLASDGPGNQTFQPVEYPPQNQKGAA